MNELAQQMIATKKLIEKENKVGGDLKGLPCPFCGLPRSLRSDYVRCNPCGTNWWIGTDLTRNPHAKPAPTGSEILTQVSPTAAHYLRMDPKSGMSEEKSCQISDKESE